MRPGSRSGVTCDGWPITDGAPRPVFGAPDGQHVAGSRVPVAEPIIASAPDGGSDLGAGGRRHLEGRNWRVAYQMHRSGNRAVRELGKGYVAVQCHVV